MRLTLAEPSYLKESISIISDLVNEARFKVTPDAIELVAMDPANVAMVIFKLLSSSFTEYDVAKEAELAINLSNLKQVLRRASPKDMLTLELDADNRLKITLKSGTTRTFNLPIIELEEKEQNHVLSALQLLDRGSYTGKQKTLLYYQNLCTHADALLVKIADLLANLDACLARFDEMKQDKTRFWIYSYVFQIERCLFPYLEQSPFLFSFLAKKRLSLRISALQGRFRERENDEYNQFAEAGIP